MVHICNGILLSHKKEQNNAICSNIDATRDDHTKWNKSDRERHILYVITYMWNLKNKIYECMRKQKQTHRYRGQTSG